MLRSQFFIEHGDEFPEVDSGCVPDAEGNDVSGETVATLARGMASLVVAISAARGDGSGVF